MHPQLYLELADARTADWRRESERHGLVRQCPPKRLRFAQVHRPKRCVKRIASQRPESHPVENL